MEATALVGTVAEPIHWRLRDEYQVDGGYADGSCGCRGRLRRRQEAVGGVLKYRSGVDNDFGGLHDGRIDYVGGRTDVRVDEELSAADDAGREDVAGAPVELRGRFEQHRQ
jgi:hypothetical protein